LSGIGKLEELVTLLTEDDILEALEGQVSFGITF
jgi:hypothetical protein